MQPYLGEIRMFGGNFAPLNWMTCDGQLVPIADYSPLFNLIGTTYGGDGVNTFALPDLRGRTPLNQGQGPSLSARVLGQSLGSETVSLTSAQAGHTHPLMASTSNASTAPLGPGGNVLGQILAPSKLYSATQASPTTLISKSVTTAGSGLPHDNMMPSLCVTFIIAMQGIYPFPS